MVSFHPAGLADPPTRGPPDQPRALASDPAKKGVHLRRIRRKLICTDPQRPAILARIRAVGRHLPPKGRLVFFDVKPVTVKAYGGRRYTSGAAPLLARYQKTRGRFYLFLLYDVVRGRAHWAYHEVKNSDQICAFMAQVRRWYPEEQVWVVLDQDTPHPRKSRQTRRVMRQLRLHWISLPKGSPDDNPVETIFSIVQTSVLESSNDPDIGSTQRRMNVLLRGRNRRHDRWIKISYLPSSHKT